MIVIYGNLFRLFLHLLWRICRAMAQTWKNRYEAENKHETLMSGIK